MKIDSYKDLIVWQKAMDLVEAIYGLTNRFPKEEIYGLTSQMRRSAVSIPSNIAEGQLRKNLREYTQFLRIAAGSSAELETQLNICKRISIVSNDGFANIENSLGEVQKMLNVIIRKLEAKNYNLKS